MSAFTIDPTLYEGRPADCTGRDPREIACYDLLDRLGVPFFRLDHDEAPSIECCAAVEARLGTDICKNLFLCNRQKTQFYLLLMPGDKEFRTKDFSAQLGISRLSFAGPEPMEEYLGVTPGSVSVLGLLNDPDNTVRLVIDRGVVDGRPFIGCHPCRNTSSLRIATSDLLEKILPALRHDPTYVSL